MLTDKQTTQSEPQETLNAIVIDFESASLKPDACILGGAMIAFDINHMGSVPNAYKSPNKLTWDRNTCMLDQFMLGCSIDKGTGEWWNQQSEQAKDSLRGNSIPVEDFVREIGEFIEDIKTLSGNKDIMIFCRHTHADWCWLDHVCTKLGVKNPINYNRIFDISTYIMSKNGNIKGYQEMEYDIKGHRHCATNDVYQDASQLAKVTQFGKLKS